MNYNYNEFKYLKEGISADLIEYLMEEFHLGVEDAIRILYNSETFEKLNNPATGLFFQSSRYVYDYLQSELKCGSMAG